MPLEEVLIPILDDAFKMLWMAAPWRWSVGILSPISVATGSDQSFSPPADFLYIIRAWITDGQSAIELHPEATLPTTNVKGVPNQIAYIASGSLLRINPVPTTLPNSGTWQLLVIYKKISPVLAKTNIFTAGTQIFDDEWFHVFKDLVLYKAFVYAGDEKAGSVNMQDGKLQYTGQLAQAMAGLALMKASEPLISVTKDKSGEERRQG